jgi:hypothetical protein
MKSAIKRVASVQVLGLGLLFLAGCASVPAKVTLHGEENRTFYAQSFSKAFISNGHNGEYDVVLLQDGQSAKGQEGNKPLQPVSSADLRQIIHIHVFWQTDGGTVARDGVVTNAAISWYMIAHEATDKPEVLRYEGAGVVTLDEGHNSTTVEIRDGTMKKTQAHGGLKDPLGPSRLNGDIKATRNNQLVEDTLADLKTRTMAGKVALSQLR